MPKFERRPTVVSAMQSARKAQERTDLNLSRFTGRVFTGLSKSGINATGTRFTLVESGFVLPRTGMVEVFAALTLTDTRSAGTGRTTGLFCRVDDGTTQTEGRLLSWTPSVTAEERWTSAASNTGITSNPGTFIVRFWDLPAGGYTINFNIQALTSSGGTVNASCTGGIVAYRII